MPAVFSRALHRLARETGFVATVLLTIALGVGGSTATFTVLNAVLLRPLPYPQPEELVAVWHRAPGMGIDDFEHDEATYLLYAEQSTLFETIGLYRSSEANLTGDGDPERLASADVTAEVFAALRVPPLAGRWILEEDEGLGATPVVVLSHELWTRRFGAAPELVGQAVDIDGEAREVVGIMPRGFGFPARGTRLWLPLQIDRSKLPTLDFGFGSVARVLPGTGTAAADQQLDQILDRLPEVFPGGITTQMLEEGQMDPYLRSLREVTLGDIAGLLWVAASVVALVLLVALANVTHLFLARRDTWVHEIGVRTALGAGRWGAVRPLIGEAVLLCVLGGALGIALAAAAVQGLVALDSADLPRLHEVRLDGAAIAWGSMTALVVGVLVGVFASLGLSRRAPVEALQGGRGGSSRVEGSRARTSLAMVEVALCAILLIGGGLLMRTFLQLRAVDPGFDADGVLVFRLILPEAKYGPGEVSTLFDLIEERVEGLPGVESAGTVSALPLAQGGQAVSYLLEDSPPDPNGVPQFALLDGVSRGYFETMRIPLLRGRDFAPADHLTPNHVAVVSEAFAQRHWPGVDPIGKRLARGNSQQRADWMTIVGVVGDVKHSGLAEPIDPAIYLPVVHPHASGTPIEYRDRTVAVRTGTGGSALAPAIREVVWSLDEDLPIVGLGPLSEVVGRSTARTTFVTLLFGVAATITLVLGSIGLYGVLSYTVSQRRREIGLRMAVGASAAVVRAMVLRQGLLVSVVGTAVGVLAALALSRLVETLLFGLSARDPLTFTAVPLVLILVAAAACYLPARRASSIDPARALRME